MPGCTLPHVRHPVSHLQSFSDNRGCRLSLPPCSIQVGSVAAWDQGSGVLTLAHSQEEGVASGAGEVTDEGWAWHAPYGEDGDLTVRLCLGGGP